MDARMNSSQPPHLELTGESRDTSTTSERCISQDSIPESRDDSLADRVADTMPSAPVDLPLTVSAKPGVGDGLKAIARMRTPWLYGLLVVLPVSWILHFASKNPTTEEDIITFVFTFLTTILLAGILSFASEELALCIGDRKVGLLHCVLGNLVELIISVIAFTEGKLEVILPSLVGSMLYNILFARGVCDLVGGWRDAGQDIVPSFAPSTASLFMLLTIAPGLLTKYYIAFTESVMPEEEKLHGILALSHVVAVLLLCLYVAFIISLFKTILRKNLRSGPNKSAQSSRSSETTKEGQVLWQSYVHHIRFAARRLLTRVDLESQPVRDSDVPGVPQLQLPVWMAMMLFLVATTLLAITAEILVQSIDGLARTGKVARAFISLVILPIAAHGADCYVVVVASFNRHGGLVANAVIGSSIQTALFVVPVLVTVGWAFQKPLTLIVEPGQVIELFVAILAAHFSMADKKLDCFKGLILMTMYGVIAVFFWHYPDVITAT